MKKALFLILSVFISLQIIAQNSPASDTCLPVPWVNAEILENGDMFVSWDEPCDTCEVIQYRLVWIDQFNACAGDTPEDGTWHHRKFTNNLSHTEPWGPRPWGGIAWAVITYYESCYDSSQSVWIYSNVVYDEFENYTLNVNVSLEGGDNPDGTNVFVDGATLCNDSLSYFEQSDMDGNTYFDEVMYGEYILTISEPGYQTAIIEDFSLYKDSTIMVELQKETAIDTCLPVPWVNAKVLENGDMFITWDTPCDTCEVIKYRLFWIEGFNPCEGETPEDGGWHHRAYQTSNFFTDTQWGPRPPGYYAYAVSAYYDSCESVGTYSNVIYHHILNYYSFTVNISLEGGDNPEGASVSVDGATLCNDSLSYFEQSEMDGNTYFDEVMYGEYMLIISKPGYQTAIIDYIHFMDSTIMVELQMGLDPPPSEFTVDANNGVASWTLPALKRNFNTPISFKISLADSLVAELEPDENSYQFESLLHDTEYTASISAIYNWGESEHVSYAFVTDFVGINENLGSTKVEIFPNPATNQLTIQSEEEILQIELLNFVGQIVYEKTTSFKRITINTSEFESGIYIIQLKTNKGTINKRIVVEK